MDVQEQLIEAAKEKTPLGRVGRVLAAVGDGDGDAFEPSASPLLQAVVRGQSLLINGIYAVRLQPRRLQPRRLQPRRLQPRRLQPRRLQSRRLQPASPLLSHLAPGLRSYVTLCAGRPRGVGAARL